MAVAALVLFFVLLFGLPLLAAASGNHIVALIGSFYRSGALVFGGGHVVLPLLQQSVVPPGWVSNDAFLAGYGAAQAVPGPLFTFAAYLGTVMSQTPNGWAGGPICVTAIYLPSFLLLVGVLPFWDALRRGGGIRAALTGVNAAVVGLLLAALLTAAEFIDFAAARASDRISDDEILSMVRKHCVMCHSQNPSDRMSLNQLVLRASPSKLSRT